MYPREQVTTVGHRLYPNLRNSKEHPRAIASKDWWLGLQILQDFKASPGAVDPTLYPSCLGLALGDSNLTQQGQAEKDSNVGTYGSGSGAVHRSCS